MVFGCVCMGEIKLILFSLHSYKKNKNNKQKAQTLGIYMHLWIYLSADRVDSTTWIASCLWAQEFTLCLLSQGHY